jgi:hypothetical protein
MVWLALLFACGSEPEPAAVTEAAKPACEHRSESEIASAGPFVIEASAEGEALNASLRNVAPLVRSALHHPVAQPSTVVLMGPDGGVIAPKDTRKEKDTALVPVTKAEWTRLEPCEAFSLGEATFAKDGAAYTFTWGPYTWKKLQPGRYTAVVSLPMVLGHYNDPLGSRHKIDEAWTGDVKSGAVEIVLP